MPKWKILVPFGAVLLATVFGLQSWQSSRFDSAHTALISLSSADVSGIALYLGDWPSGESTETVNPKYIDDFLHSLRDLEKYQPNHEVTDFPATVLIEPQGIHLRLSVSRRHPTKVLGAIGKFESATKYLHYGSFLSESLYSWYEENVVRPQQQAHGGT